MLEVFCNKLRKEISKCDNNINYYNYELNKQLYNPVPPEPVTDSEYDKGTGVIIFSMVLPTAFCIWLSSLSDNFLIKTLETILWIGVVLWDLGLMMVLVAGANNAEKDKASRYESALKEYNRQVQHDELIRRNHNTNVHGLADESAKVKILKKQLKEATNLLIEVYDVNIIPRRYRNLQVAYYLYDFFNFGREDDLEKVLQTMLIDEIVEKLNTIIEQNEETIINQYKQILLQKQGNEQQIKHHKEQMDKLLHMEANQERQMDYQNMFARNQEVANFFLASDYLRKLDK